MRVQSCIGLILTFAFSPALNADPVQEWEPDFSLTIPNGVVYEQSGRLLFLEPVAEFIDGWETWTDVRRGELLLPGPYDADVSRPLEEQIEIAYDECDICSRIAEAPYLVHDLAALLTQYWYGWPDMEPGQSDTIFRERVGQAEIQVEVHREGDGVQSDEVILGVDLVEETVGAVARFEAFRSSPSFILVRDGYLIAGMTFFGGSGHTATINLWRIGGSRQTK